MPLRLHAMFPLPASKLTSRILSRYEDKELIIPRFCMAIVMNDRTPIVILGCGYVGRVVARRLTAQGRSVHATGRGSGRESPDCSGITFRQFDLARPDTWANIPRKADLLWTFPAAPLELVERCAPVLIASARRLVVLGSTSAYELPHGSDEYPPPWLEESAAIDVAKPRVQGEEFLRRRYGAIILRVAGIYGPGRNPLDWISSGRVTASRKYVNLIHVEDLTTACLAALARGTPGSVYNVSDGRPRTWEDICRIAAERWRILAAPTRNQSPVGKRISNARLLALLDADGTCLRYPDLVGALDDLHNAPVTPAAAS
jgi:nucleoside-diphosphate-sugar epimerase